MYVCQTKRIKVLKMAQLNAEITIQLYYCVILMCLMLLKLSQKAGKEAKMD